MIPGIFIACNSDKCPCGEDHTVKRVYVRVCDFDYWGKAYECPNVKSVNIVGLKIKPLLVVRTDE